MDEPTSRSPEWQIYAEIGRRVRSRRDALGMSQAELARMVGLTRGSITNIEAGIQKLPIDVLYDIASALGIAPDSLLPPSTDEEGDNQEAAPPGVSENSDEGWTRAVRGRSRA